jgi:hypothetical protein
MPIEHLRITDCSEHLTFIDCSTASPETCLISPPELLFCFPQLMTRLVNKTLKNADFMSSYLLKRLGFDVNELIVITAHKVHAIIPNILTIFDDASILSPS